MPKFRNKPVEVEAEQYTGPQSIDRFEQKPAAPAGVKWESFDTSFRQFPVVKTLEGEVVVRPGDWIVTGTSGEIYRCKPDIFEQTYEPVEA